MLGLGRGSQLKMGIILSATDRMSAKVDKAFGHVHKKLSVTQQRFDKISRKTGQFGRGAMAVGLGMGAALAVPVKMGMDLEQQMAMVGAVSNATDKQLQQMTDTVRKQGQTTQYTALESAQAMQYLAMAGLSVDDSIKALPKTLQLAAAGQIDMARAADIVTNVMTGFQMKAGELGKANDILTNTFTSSNTTLEQLGLTMKYVAPVAAFAGEKLGTLSGMAGALAKAGLRGEQSGRMLRQALLKLAAPTKEAQKELAALGVVTKNSRGELKPMVQLLTEIGQKTQAMPKGAGLESLKNIFQSESAAAAAILTEQAAKGDLQRYIAQVTQENNAAQNVANKQLATTMGNLKLLKSAATEVALSIFDGLSPSLNGLITNLTETTNKINDWIDKNPVLTRRIAKVTAGLAGFLTVTGAVALGISGVTFTISTFAGVGAALTPVLGMMTSGLTTMGAAMWAATGPVGLIVAGVAALSYGFYVAWQRSDKFRGTVMGIAAAIKYLMNKFNNLMATGFGRFMEFGAGAVTGNFGMMNNAFTRKKTGQSADTPMSIGDAYQRGYQNGVAMDTRYKKRQKQRAGTGRTVQIPSINYSPSIEIKGTPSEEDKQSFMDMLRQHSRELKSFINEENRKEQRLAF